MTNLRLAMMALMISAAAIAQGQVYAAPPCSATPTNPYLLPTVGPQPELTGDYAYPYLYSAETGQVYSDPMYYYGLRQLAKWDMIKPRGGKTRSVSRTSTSATPAEQRSVRTTRTTTQQTQRTATRRTNAEAAAIRDEVSDK